MAVVTFVCLVFETWTLGNKCKYYLAFHVTFPFKRQKDSQELRIRGTERLHGQYKFIKLRSIWAYLTERLPFVFLPYELFTATS